MDITGKSIVEVSDILSFFLDRAFGLKQVGNKSLLVIGERC
jgi:hypothetical protein